MKITKRQLRRIIKEATGGIPAGHMADALVAHLMNPDTDLMSTDEVVEWLSREFNLEAAEDYDDYQSDDKLIDNVLNDTRLDDLYEPRDDAWGVSEVPYAGPGDGSLMRGLTTGIRESNFRSDPRDEMKEAGLNAKEIKNVERWIESDDGSFYGSPEFDKLYAYFAFETGEITPQRLAI